MFVHHPAALGFEREIFECGYCEGFGHDGHIGFGVGRLAVGRCHLEGIAAAARGGLGIYVGVGIHGAGLVGPGVGVGFLAAFYYGIKLNLLAGLEGLFLPHYLCRKFLDGLESGEIDGSDFALAAEGFNGQEVGAVGRELVEIIECRGNLHIGFAGSGALGLELLGCGSFGIGFSTFLQSTS